MDMENVMEKVKVGAATVVDETEKMTKSVVRKTSSFVEQTKIKFTMNDLEKRIKEECSEIGKYVYKQHLDGAEFNDFAGEKCEILDKLYDEYDALKKQLADANNSIICGECEAVNPDTNKHCSQCGAKL